MKNVDQYNRIGIDIIVYTVDLDLEPYEYTTSIDIDRDYDLEYSSMLESGIVLDR